MSGKSRRPLAGKRGHSQVIEIDTRPADESANACAEWLSRNAEYEKLIRRWQRLETPLIREHDLFKLTKRDRAALSEACELDAINSRIVALY